MATSLQKLNYSKNKKFLSLVKFSYYKLGLNLRTKFLKLKLLALN